MNMDQDNARLLKPFHGEAQKELLAVKKAST